MRTMSAWIRICDSFGVRKDADLYGHITFRLLVVLLHVLASYYGNQHMVGDTLILTTLMH